jgi:hypothetical protein
MNPDQSIESALPLLCELRRLLLQHKGKNLASGVEHVVDIIQDENILVTKKFSDAARAYRGLMRGPGTLGDFVIWNSNPEICKSLNNDLEIIFKSLWDIFQYQ